MQGISFPIPALAFKIHNVAEKLCWGQPCITRPGVLLIARGTQSQNMTAWVFMLMDVQCVPFEGEERTEALIVWLLSYKERKQRYLGWPCSKHKFILIWWESRVTVGQNPQKVKAFQFPLELAFGTLVKSTFPGQSTRVLVTTCTSPSEDGSLLLSMSTHLQCNDSRWIQIRFSTRSGPPQTLPPTLSTHKNKVPFFR